MIETATTDKMGISLKYYVEDPMAPNVKSYVRESSREIAGGVTTYTYEPVIATDGLIVKLPSASNFAHLEYGVWSMLGDPDDAGMHYPKELGIGFVDGTDMTMDMPNFGKAMYKGNWVANVQSEDEEGDGDIRTKYGIMELKTDFTKDTVMVDLKGLADLEGAISGNTFSGDRSNWTLLIPTAWAPTNRSRFVRGWLLRHQSGGSRRCLRLFVDQQGRRVHRRLRRRSGGGGLTVLLLYNSGRPVHNWTGRLFLARADLTMDRALSFPANASAKRDWRHTGGRGAQGWLWWPKERPDNLQGYLHEPALSRLCVVPGQRLWRTPRGGNGTSHEITRADRQRR